MRTTFPAKRKRVHLQSFSLIELVIAIAVLSFSLIVVIGMLGQGLSNNRDSSSRLQAADIASLLISARRAAPTSTNLANFALAPLGAVNGAGKDVVTATTNYTKVLIDGTTIASAAGAATNVIYNLRSIVTASGSQNNIANVDLVLWWPPTLAASISTLPTNNPSSYYEVMTQIALP